MKIYLKATLVTALILIVLYLVGSSLYLAVEARRVLAIKEQVPVFADLVTHQNWDRILFELPPLEETLQRADTSASLAGWIGIVPYVKSPFLAYKDGVRAGVLLVRTLRQSLQESVRDQNGKMTVDTSAFITASLQSYPALVDAFQHLQSSLDHFQTLAPTSSLAPFLAEAGQLQVFVQAFSPYVDQLPMMLGSDGPYNILILLENPNELRPTGGFLGTYGRLTFDHGQITTFFTDDIYNLDANLLQKKIAIPPQPLQTYLNIDRWFVRDANWSPDFPTSAKQISDLYEMASGEKNVDLVVALTPRLVQDFLRQTGPIETDGITFTADNLVDALQYRVEQQFWHIGLKDEERKKVINDLAQELKKRFFSMNADQAKQFVASFQQSLKEKDILVFAKSSALQNQLHVAGWTGELTNTTDDYLAVIDANLGALKTDRLVDRTFSRSIKQQSDGSWIATLQLTYKNNAKTFDYRTTRYRDYVRVYLPLGSGLLSSQGYMDNDKLAPTAKPEVYAELGKTVIAGFVSIEPGQQRTISLTYTLPAWLNNRIRSAGQYDLLWQKEPGTAAHTIFALESAKPLFSFAPSELSYKLETPQKITAQDVLRFDRLYRVGLTR